MSSQQLKNLTLKVAVMAFISCLIGGSIIQTAPVEAATPTYSNVTYQGADIHFIKVDLADTRTIIWPQGAENHLPLYTTTTTQPLWDDQQNHAQDLLAMYNGAAIPGTVAKYGMINTDYFCRWWSGSCTPGTGGAPQGLFVRQGVKYHYPGPKKRAALVFNSANTASINVYTGNPSITGIYNAVSGGPVMLRNGVASCDPDGETDIPSAHCSETITIYRTAACITSDGKTLYLIATANPVTKYPVTNFMISKGCWNGMAFDSNTSTSLVYSGQQKVKAATVGTGLLIGYRLGTAPSE